MYLKNRRFLKGVVFTLLMLIAFISFDRLLLGGKFSTQNDKITRLEKDLEYTTGEALELGRQNTHLLKKIQILRPLAERTLEKEQKLLATEEAYTQAQLMILSLSDKIEALKNQFQIKLAELQGLYPDLIDFYNGRYSFNTALLFGNASATLNEEGEAFLMRFSAFLKEFIQSAPEGFDWFIRVDGHTNHLPIETDQFPSNWHLASARALAVTTFLQEQGIPGRYLVASSFGEFWPMVSPESAEAIEKNRRIEFSISHY